MIPLTFQQTCVRFATALVLVGTTAVLLGETPAEQEAAVTAIRRVASNIQKNRDGTVRFVRLSKPAVTDEHLAQLRSFKQLDYLAVVTPTVSDCGLTHIAGLTNLDTLVLSNSGLTSKGMPALAALAQLERLYLDATKITDASLDVLSDLTKLNTVSLNETAISDAGIERLTALENLEVLFLGRTHITDVGLQSLARLSKLRVLYLDYTAVSGSGLAALAANTELRTLSLTGTAVVTRDLESLAGLDSLKQVLLYDTASRSGTTVATATFSHELPRYDGPRSNTRSAFARFLAGEPLQGAPPRVLDEISAVDQHRSHPPLRPPADERFTNTDEVPDFQRHVVPLLGRLGCNGRTCHGSFQGQGGFRLSMFGYDFAADLAALSERIDIATPTDSLLLRKPTLREDHEGGQRFDANGWEHQMLLRWIETGAPGGDNRPQRLVRLDLQPREIVFTQVGQQIQLKVVAVWSDGTREDVTCLARFRTNDGAVAEVTARGTVHSRGPGDTHVIAFYDNGIFATQVLSPTSDRVGNRFPEIPTPSPIDEFVVAKLSKLGLVPSPLCSDEEFLRRVSLDLIGTLPAPAQTESFVADHTPNKRARKIQQLLETPAYTDWWTVLLSDLTGSNAQYLGTTDMNQPAAKQWNHWLGRRLRDNVGWDRIAAGIILAESRRPGQTYEQYVAEQSLHLRRHEPTDFTALDKPMHYYWFRSNNQQPTDRALSFGYVFLGVRLQCAQCHKHPFDQWSKPEFDKFTQFFTRIQAGIAPDAQAAQRALKTRLGVPDKLNTAALRRQMYMRVAAEGLPIPWNEIWVDAPGSTPQIAKLLGGAELDLAEFEEPREPLVAWLLDQNNPYFARAFVNRVWAHYFGQGIVDPPDDFNRANPPSNRALLDWLAKEFIHSGYDIKWLHRTITNSRTYQLSSRPNETNRHDTQNFSRALVRRLPAEVTIDAILQATANDRQLQSWATQTERRKIAQHPKSIQTRGIDYSLLVFGKPLRTTNCDCERQQQPTLLQSLYVRNDHELIGWLERPDGWLQEVARSRGETLQPETEVRPDPAATEFGSAPTSDAAEIDELVRSAYLRTLSREPRQTELSRARQHVATSESVVEGLRDLMWALVNSKEFLTNH